MRLLIVSFWIACKHSSRRLLCLLCVFLVLAGLVGLGFALRPQTEYPRAVVAVVNRDQNPLSQQAMEWLAQAGPVQGLEGILELRFLDQEPEPGSGYTAVVTVPDGFLESVLNGSNLSPKLQVDVGSPLEALWVERIAEAGASWLTNAQLGVYTVQEQIGYGRGMDARQYDILLAGINMAYLRAFFDRLDPLEIKELSASGGLSLPAYYLLAAAVVLLFAYGFLFQPACRDLWAFSRSCGRRISLFFAAAAHVYLLTLVLCILITAAARGLLALQVASWPHLLLLALLVGGGVCLAAVLFRAYAPCAAACILCALGMGACGGGFLPLALMPVGFERLAPLLPFWQGLRLLGQVFGEPGQPLWQPLAMGILLWAAAALAWFGRRGRQCATS